VAAQEFICDAAMKLSCIARDEEGATFTIDEGGGIVNVKDVCGFVRSWNGHIDWGTFPKEVGEASGSSHSVQIPHGLSLPQCLITGGYDDGT
jgi:hypothetical protein